MLSFKSQLMSRTLVSASLLGLVFILGACGFKPMYGSQPNTVATSAYLRAVSIDHIDGRTGQMMRTALKRRFHPTRTNTAYQYALEVNLGEGVSELAVEKDASTTRANLKLEAQYKLIRNADHFMLQIGKVRSVASYNLLTSYFATEAAKKDARERAITAIADQLTTRISVYFQGPGLKQPPLGYKQDIQ